MLELGAIQPSACPWASPVALVEKKDGEVRFCVDYRKLNQVARSDAYPMPRVEEVLETVGLAKFISTLDLARGYWQVPMAEESKEKTAFTTPYGLFEFNVMPFGLHNAPATFQRLMNRVLQGCQSFAQAYIDDIVVYSRTWEEHLQHPRKVFNCLLQAGLILKLPKCQFGLNKVHYLGHIIGNGELLPDPQKLEAVKGFRRPETKSEVNSFIGLTSYYRKFVPDFATIATPLTNLLKKRQPERVLWTQECEQAFQNLKTKLIKPPILKVPEVNKQFSVHSDASDVGLGAVLNQIGEDGEEHPVAYASRKLKPRETRYSTIEKECLAAVWALKFFEHYLYGQPFTLVTDHRPLTWLKNMKNSNQRLTRWAVCLQQFKFEVQQRPEAKYQNADGLS